MARGKSKLSSGKSKANSKKKLKIKVKRKGTPAKRRRPKMRTKSKWTKVKATKRKTVKSKLKVKMKHKKRGSATSKARKVNSQSSVSSMMSVRDSDESLGFEETKKNAKETALAPISSSASSSGSNSSKSVTDSDSSNSSNSSVSITFDENEMTDRIREESDSELLIILRERESMEEQAKESSNIEVTASEQVKTSGSKSDDNHAKTGSTDSIVLSVLPEKKSSSESSSEEEPPKMPEPVEHFLAEEKYTVVKYLASSTTCEVFLVKNRAGIYRAAKVIDHLKLPELIRQEHLPQELKIICMVRHVNIVRIDTVLTELANYSIIIGEYAEDGDLITYMENREDCPPSLPQIKKWFHEITNALHYLHDQYIAHRDIKLDNILLCRGLVAKLADFGFATFCRNPTTGEAIMCDTFCGTTEYQAPETLLCDEPYDGRMADLFSLGVVLHVMCTRKFPFGSGEEVQTPGGIETLHTRILAKEWPKTGIIEKDAVLRSLLKQLLNPDVEERIRITQVLEHPWIKGD